MGKKKLLHIQLLPLLSGVQNVMLHILEGLDEAEFEIYVACRPNGPLVDEVLRRGYHFLPLPLFTRRLSLLDLPVFLQLLKLCRTYRFDIVHTHSSKPGLLGRLAARLAGVPCIIHTAHGAPFHDFQPYPVQLTYMLLEKFAARYCDWMVFVNEYHRECYIRYRLVEPARALTLYNAISPGLQSRLAAVPDQHKPDPEIVTIGSICRFSHQKNMVMTVLGAIRVCQNRPNVRFIFLGDGELFSLCRSMVATHKLQERILLPGWEQDTPAWLARFDVFMLYSNYEGLPMGIIEAMFAALPVIASDLPMNAELVDNTNGWLITANDPDCLAAGLIEALDDRQSYGQKGMFGRKKAQELCSHDKFIQGYLSLYRGVKP